MSRLLFSGRPESRTQHRVVISRAWATGPRLPSPTSSSVGVAGFEPAVLWSQTTRDTRLRYTPIRPPTAPRCFHPHTIAVCRSTINGQFKPVRTAGFEPTISCTPSTRNTKLSHVLFSSSCGNRTHLSGLKGQNPKPIEERAMQWIGWCSNPRLRLFRPPLNRLSYQSNNASSVTRNASKFRTQTTVIRFAPPKRNRNQ